MVATRPLPTVLPGFEHVNRYWDKAMDVPAAKIMPGEFYVSKSREMIVTVLGSCISACVRDVELGIGGMNHFMLPQQGNHSSKSWGDSVSSASRYGNWAMEFLINEILKLGGTRRNLEFKVFGGGNVMKNMTDIGSRNIQFVKDYIHQENFDISASDLGDTFARKVLYFPDTGAVKLRKLRETANNTLIQRELSYSKTLETDKPSSGEVELF